MADNLRKICILGSSGSIGTQTLDIIDRIGGFRIKSLAVDTNIDRLEAQIRKYRPEMVCVYSQEKASELRGRVSDTGVKVLCGMEGLCELASDPDLDLVVTAIVGMIGIKPTVAAIKAGHDIALANKETLVTAGHIIIPMAAENHVKILPVDSEHSAIFQCLQGHNGPDGSYFYSNNEISKILLTASGGPFRGMNYGQISRMKAADALRHPNWLMGKKITIDSASMVNKALEVMEARWLFNVDPDDITVVIQPKSIIHSAVAFRDGAIIAQLAAPDMRLPIQYALYYPERPEGPVSCPDLFEIGKIEFEKPDYETFRGLRLGLDAIKAGGSICTVFNAANEFAVAQFLQDRIAFTDIYGIIEFCMESHKNIDYPSLEDILETEKMTRSRAEAFLRSR